MSVLDIDQSNWGEDHPVLEGWQRHPILPGEDVYDVLPNRVDELRQPYFVEWQSSVMGGYGPAAVWVQS